MERVRPVAKDSKMNKADAAEPKSGHERPAGGQKLPVGNESRPDMEGALNGEPTDKSPLHGAVRELGEQHPIHYSDRGPHYGTDHHVRHEPMHGMKVK